MSLKFLPDQTTADEQPDERPVNTAPMTRKFLNLIAEQIRPAFVQAAALCLRDRSDGAEVLLIRTLRLKQWIIPKGWPMKGKTLAEAAAIEAWEEAGVRGVIGTEPIGAFTYTKVKKSGLPVSCRARIFRLDVTEIAERYPEAGRRERRWVPLAKAANLVRDPELALLLQQMARRAENT